MKRLLIGIDQQIDFHDVQGAALPVPGSTKDCTRFSKAIDSEKFDALILSLDSHHDLDISHPGWWRDHKGDDVSPFTLIRHSDILDGKFVPKIDPVRSTAYVKSLEDDGEFLHFIWPVHCKIGSEHHALMSEIMSSASNWSMKKKRWVNFINKGANPNTEHFGIFRANVPLSEDPNTQVNQGLFQHMNSFDEIWIGGQARGHCVLNSIKQLLQISPSLTTKLVIMEDCMSNVVGLPDDFNQMVEDFYSEQKNKGVKFQKSTDI